MNPNTRTVCRACGSDMLEYLFSARGRDVPPKHVYRIDRCKRCGLANVFPENNLPLPDDNALYNAEYYGSPVPFLHALIASFMNLFFTVRLHRIIHLARQGAVCDIGCGDGNMIRLLKKRGVDASGVEVHYHGKEDIEVVPNLDAFPPDKQFSLITLWHVLEHLENPRDILEHIHARLMANGALFISIPNIGSWEAQLGKQAWFHLDVPRHVIHFTPESIEKLVASRGFRVEKISHHAFFYNAFSILQTILNRIHLPENFLYNSLKRGTDYIEQMGIVQWMQLVVLHIMIVPVLMPFSAVAAYAAAWAKKSGTIELLCRKTLHEAKYTSDNTALS